MRNELSNRLGVTDIRKICIEIQGDSHRMSDLYQLTFDADDRVALMRCGFSPTSIQTTRNGSIRSKKI